MQRVTSMAALLAATGFLGAWTPPPSTPVTINATNRAAYTHELPTGRRRCANRHHRSDTEFPHRHRRRR